MSNLSAASIERRPSRRRVTLAPLTQQAAAAILRAQVEDLASDEITETAYAGGNLTGDQCRYGRKLLLNEARGLDTRKGSAQRPARLRTGAGTAEMLSAFKTLRDRVDELRSRIDQTYEAIERDEGELETLVEIIESAAHDSMDFTAEEQGEGEDDVSFDDDDSDIDFAESVTRGCGPLRASHAQAVAIGMGPSMLNWCSADEIADAVASLQTCGHPLISSTIRRDRDAA